MLLFKSTSPSYNRLGKLARLPRVLRILRVLRLLRLMRVVKVSTLLAKLEAVADIHTGVTRMFSTLFWILLATHLVSCIWHLIVTVDHETLVPAGSWIEQHFGTRKYREIGVGKRYLASCYWAFSSLTTVGYGDITGDTIPEQIFAIFIMMMGVSWYAFIVSTISDIMGSFQRHDMRAREKKNALQNFMRDAQLPIALRTSLQKNLKFHLKDLSNSKLYNVEHVLADMPSNLRCDVIMYVNRDIIEKIPFFSGKSPQLASAMVKHLRAAFTCSGDYVIRDGDHADVMYFITKGKAAVMKDGHVIASVGAGDFIGEL